MAQITITFTHKVNGTLTNATSAVLSDPTGTFGVKRNDTDATVVADGAAMTNSATGVYTYTFTEPAAGLTYTYYVEWVYAGLTHRAEFGVTGATTDLSSASGTYCDGTDIEDRFGVENVARWSQLDNDVTTADLNRVQAAIDWSYATINDTLRDGPYAIPLSPVGQSVRSWAATLAGWWLYSSRGLRDETPDGSFMQQHYDKAMRELMQVRSGLLRLDCGRAGSYQPTAAVVV